MQPYQHVRIIYVRYVNLNILNRIFKLSLRALYRIRPVKRSMYLLETKSESMRNILFTLLASLLVVSVAISQDGEKSLKQASKSLSEYMKDPFNNGAALEEAKNQLEMAFEDEAVTSEAKSWITRGEIYYNIGDSQIKSKLLNPDAPINDPTAGVDAYEAYMKGFELSEKKGDKKSALNGLKDVATLLNTIGVELYRLQDYDNAYATFDTEVKLCDFMRSQEEECILDSGTLYTEKIYFAGLTAYYANKPEGAVELLMKAKETGTDEASLYTVMYESYKAMDKAEEGLAFLEEGRKKFPDDSGLLFSEINHYLAAGELDQMIGKLKEALEKEPDNTSVILTLGQVYDELQVKAIESGDVTASDEYFGQSLGYYKMALEKDPENFDLNYSLGALFYNKAAGLTAALNEVANDFSAAGTKKYDEIKTQMTGLFDQALPYFLKADSLNNADRNTLIALKEIYARKDNFEKSNAYKAKLEALPEN